MITGEQHAGKDEANARRFSVHVAIAKRITIAPTNWRMEIRSPFWRLYRMSGPGAGLRWEGGRLELAAGAVYLVPAWVRFCTETRSELVHDYMHFYLSGLPLGWVREAFATPVRVPGSAAAGALAERWAEALGAGGGGVFGAYGWGAALAQAAVVGVVEALPRIQRERLQGWLASAEEVRPATERIKRSLALAPGNPELAALCGVGVDQFVRRFKAGTGMTPTQYRLERCVQEVARLLAETERKLEDIAEATGFTDRFYLSRVFKARLGMTPAAYRRAHRLEREEKAGGPRRKTA